MTDTDTNTDAEFSRLMARLATMQIENRHDQRCGDEPRWSDLELSAVSDEIEALRRSHQSKPVEHSNIALILTDSAG